MNYFSVSISDPACNTEFDLLYDFISATVFGQGNMVLTFQFFWVGYEFTSGAFRIYFLSI